MFRPIHHGDLCPRCREAHMQRCRRQDWMRRVPRSKYHKCPNCQARFLSVWQLAIPLRQGQEKIRDTKKVEAP